MTCIETCHKNRLTFAIKLLQLKFHCNFVAIKTSHKNRLNFAIKLLQLKKSALRVGIALGR